MILAPLAVMAAPAMVTEIVKTPQGYQLLHHGKPYFIKGAGAHKELLPLFKAAGGNSIRTWGAGPDIGELLDKCQEMGITVTVGIWLRKEEDGFRYDKKEDRQSQYRHAIETVRKYKHHPAVLMWAVGNEMELGAPDDRVWHYVERIARIFKRNDPTRPVMTVVADMWPQKMDAILRWAPSIDILGVNSYEGLPSLESRMTRWTKPYVLTEFAFTQGQEGRRLPFGLSLEMNSTRKAEGTKANYEKTILGLPGRVLGSYYFHWSKSSTQTASMHSAFLRTGEKLGVIDELTRLWSGKEPENRAPVIRSAKALDKDEQSWELDVVDPDGDSLDYTLEVTDEDPAKRFVGDFEKELPKVVNQAVGPRFTIPSLPKGRYRAYVIIRDGKGAAAMWNNPFQR